MHNDNVTANSNLATGNCEGTFLVSQELSHAYAIFCYNLPKEFQLIFIIHC